MSLTNIYIAKSSHTLLSHNTALLEGTEESQVMGSKCKEVASRDKERQ